jgi:hypothetical protein
MPGLTWEAESARITVFYPDGLLRAGSWQLLTKAEPVTAALDRKTQRVEERGLYADECVSFLGTPGRVDWVVTDATTLEGGDPGAPPTMKMAEALGAARQVAHGWFASADNVVRIAAGLVLTAPVPNRVEGYHAIATYLHSLKLDPASQDLLYQINRPRQSSSIGDLQVNRLSRWMVQVRQRFQISGDLMNTRPLEPEYVCRLELDISTVGHRPLASDKLASLWDELSTICTEIAEKGDVQ